MVNNETGIQNEHVQTHTIIALEGPFGCGKTAVGYEIKERNAITGRSTEMYKLGGLGDDQVWLKEIKTERQKLYQAHLESPRQQREREIDRIYHLAAVKQGRSIKNKLSLLPEQTLILLDRTPFVGYAYLMALDGSNPYLETIYEQNLSVAKRMGMHGVMLFDLPIEEAYARTLARYFVTDTEPLIRTNQVISKIEAPGEASQLIRNRTMELIGSGTIKAREFDDRHFINYELAKEQRDTYKKALTRAQQNLGFDLTIINAEQSFDVVVADTIREIDRIRASRLLTAPPAWIR